MTAPTSDLATPKPPRTLLWGGHIAVWILAALSARLSRVGSQIELHITGLNGAELAPDHLRQILTAPNTEFKAISFAGVVSAVGLAIAFRRQSPVLLRRITLSVAVLAFVIVAIGYGH